MTKIILKSFLLVFLALPAFADSSQLCGQNFNNQISFSRAVAVRDTSDFSVITWNAHKLADKQFLPDLIHLSQYADVILIQEAMHSDGLQNTFLRNFEFSFSFFKSFCNGKDQATGVMTASRYELENNSALVSQDTEPFTFTPKVSGYSTIEVPELGKINIINTHALNFNLGSKFKNQIDQVAEFISHLEGPVIWAGDFNTWIADRKNYLDQKARVLGLQHIQPLKDHRILKLDQVYARGLEVIDIEILENIKSSDHLPIKIVFKKTN